jgi:hypothetical protein
MVKKVRQKLVVVYYESIRREVKIRPTYECWCDGRLQTKAEESTRLVYTGLLGELTVFTTNVNVYYESIKRDPKIKKVYECRCDERLQTKTKKFTCLPYTGLVLELEHLKIETRLISERFANAMGE